MAVRYGTFFFCNGTGTVRRFCKGTGTVRWYSLLIKNPKLFAHYAGFLYAEAKNR